MTDGVGSAGGADLVAGSASLGSVTLTAIVRWVSYDSSPLFFVERSRFRRRDVLASSHRVLHLLPSVRPP